MIVEQSLQNVVNSVKPGHPLHRNLECILYKIPVEMRDKMARRGNQDDGNPANIPSEKTLVRLHKQVGLRAKADLKKIRLQYIPHAYLNSS